MADTIDPLAVQIALNAATDEARDFLRRQAEVSAKQSRLLDLQIENLQKADEFENSHLRWRRFGEQMGGALQIMLVLAGLAIVVGLGAAIWNAASDNGLVIEAFSVPPDLAARGLTGEVVADKVLDRLSLLQAQTTSARVSTSYANNWGDDIKVQIPNTGVSIGEFNRALHQWLGHATHISGEVYRTPSGIAVSARVGTLSTPVFAGGEGDVDALVDQAAERIYRSTQPYRYATWLSSHGRVPEAVAVLNTIIETGTPLERGWAYNGMASITLRLGDDAGADDYVRKALAIDPNLLLPRINLIGGEAMIGHDEAILAGAPGLEAAAAAGDPTLVKARATQSLLAARFVVAETRGDGAAALDIARQFETANDAEDARQDEAAACALLHDDACFRTAVSALAPTQDAELIVERSTVLQQARAALGRWEAVLHAAPVLHAAMLRGPRLLAVMGFVFDAPYWALAAAHLGDFATAHRMIDRMPADCVVCLRVRGQIDALQGNPAGAAWWFARAQAAAPSSPFPPFDWGTMLLRKGDLDGAIAKFTRAHDKGPHLADPLEMWGEALIAKNRSDLALAKFEEADKHAPNWGRLHLKWGEALLWSGDKDGAAKQFALAANLDLSADDRAVLARLETRHG